MLEFATYMIVGECVEEDCREIRVFDVLKKPRMAPEMLFAVLRNTLRIAISEDSS